MTRILAWLALAVAGPALAAETITATMPPTLGPWSACAVWFSHRAAHTPRVVFQNVPVALTRAQQRAGMNARAAVGVPLMLFGWPDAKRRPFWMQGVSIPLSVAFIGLDGRVIDVQRMAADSTVYHWSPGPIVAGMEAETPLLESAGIQAGSVIHVAQCESLSFN